MNLLPAEYQKSLFYERVNSFVLFIGMRMAFAVLISIILLLPAYFFLTFQEKELRREAAVLGESSRLEEFRGLEADIKDFNDTLVEFEKAGMADLSRSDILKDIVARSPFSIKYRTLVYDAKERHVTINGEALARKDLLGFIEKLKESTFVERVDSPISNLLEERNVIFSLTIFLKDSFMMSKAESL